MGNIQKENTVILTGVYKTERVSDSFSKQVLVFESKDRDGNWKPGSFEIYIKPDLVQQTGLKEGDIIKAKGFIVFSFFTKQDGTQMTFPKMVVNEILERQAVGDQQQQPYAQPTQPAMMAQGVPPMPGGAPTAPQPQMQGMVPPTPPTPPTPPMPNS